MNTYSRRNSLLAVVAVAMLAVATSASAVSFVNRDRVSFNNQNSNISVFDGKATYDNSGTSDTPFTGTFGDGTVVDYAFFTTKGNALTQYAAGTEGRIHSVTASFLTQSGQNWADVWTTSDPGTGFNTSKDFDGGPNPTATHAMAAQVDGTIDVSGLASGQIYVPHGTFNNGWTLEMTMSGAGQTDIVDLDSNGGIGNNNEGYITEFSFDTMGGLYDTITFEYAHSDRDGSPGSRARFMGVILDGSPIIPEPATATLAMLGLAGLARRRRRIA